MKRLKQYCAILLSFSFAFVGSEIAVAHDGAPPGPEENMMNRYAEAYHEDQLVIQHINDNIDQLLEEGRLASSNDVKANDFAFLAYTLGSYGDILVSTTTSSGSSAFAGHAAIVSSESSVTIESYAKDWSPIHQDGVQRYGNDWANKSGAYLLRPYGATSIQFSQAASYAASQVGKPYNWNFFDKNTTARFYCSQLVWHAWLSAGIDVEAGSFPNAVVAPADLIDSSNTYVVRRV